MANTNGIDEMLDMLYELIDEAKGVPFTSECRLDRNGALDLLDSIRSRFPVEIEEAERIVQNRDRYIQEAQQEAEHIIQRAQERAERAVEDTEVMRQARTRAEEPVKAAKAKAAEIMTQANNEAESVTSEARERADGLKRAANEYCADALRRTEDAVAEAYGEIKQSHDHFRALVGNGGNARGNRTAYDSAKDF